MGSDEFMGSVSLDINKGLKEGYMSFNNPQVKATWHDLCFDKFTDVGKVLASFNLYDAQNDPNPKIKMIG